MAILLVSTDFPAQSFHVRIDGDYVGFVYRDVETGEWLLTADAMRFETRAALPAPFERWTYEFESLTELCAFLTAPHPGAQGLRDAA
ncbi:hypothetical protein [Methylobacterium sp. V23]|uniref:hypothetical protein n=1 Tax=Methylobacterium sp. V23 TaxID=2044878 RepID=UPI000CDB8A6E|nr:hypothetical protein [Methylobacterium sp. V23]POR42534.1 hypothetical protein CRT23_12130 [Methylobacterium sp. V23]